MSDQKNYFNPTNVNDIFVEITQKPHCSGCEDDVRAYVISVVNDFNKKNPGKKIKIIQYNEGTANVLKGGGMTEKDGTTLGADDGIGLATALVIITDTGNAYGPIECLFTVQEETDMGGAKEFDISWLTGKKYINLDSEDYNIITFGSAGGSSAVYEITPVSKAIPVGYHVVSITLDGITGGHSGVNINEGNANAIKVLTQLLSRLMRVKKMDFNIVNFNGGSKTNAIPNSASVNIALNSGICGDFQKWAHIIFGNIKNLYQNTDPGFDWCINNDITDFKKMMDTVSSHNLIDMLLDIPTGPLKMLSDPTDVVETSTNLAIVTADTEKITIQCSNRSSFHESLAAVEDMQKAIACLYRIRMEENSAGNGNKLTIGNRYPAWDPNKDSQLLKIAKTVYEDVYGHGNWKYNVIHAGLECSWVAKKFKDAIDCIAIGPTIKTPHTWNERLYTDTVEPFYECVNRILNKIWE